VRRLHIARAAAFRALRADAALVASSPLAACEDGTVVARYLDALRLLPLEEMASRAAAPVTALCLCEPPTQAAATCVAGTASAAAPAVTAPVGGSALSHIADLAASRTPYACRYARVAVLGDASYPSDADARAAVAEAVGRALAAAGYLVISGGLGGAMEAASRGAAAALASGAASSSASRSCGLDIWVRGPPPQGPVGILPGPDHAANPFVAAALHTGIGHARNAIVATTADAVVIVGGGAGTMAEAAAAWTAGRLLVAMEGTGGTADLLAGRRLDRRRRLHGDGARAIPLEEDVVHAASSVSHALAIIVERVHWHRLESLRRAGAAQSPVAPW